MKEEKQPNSNEVDKLMTLQKTRGNEDTSCPGEQESMMIGE